MFKARLKHPSKIILSATAIALLWCSSASADKFPRAKPESQGVSSERLERMTTNLQGYIDDNHLSGTISLVARNGKVLYLNSQGWKNKETDQLMTDDTIYHIMSITKTVVAVGLMMLHEEGHFRLTDSVTKFIPEMENLKVVVKNEDGTSTTERVDAVRPITFRHLLTHQSGLVPPRDMLTEEELEVRKLHDTVEDNVIAWSSLPLSFHPGDEWKYGLSSDYIVLIIERISGMPIEKFLQERIFKPLKMKDTGYSVPEEKLHRVASVYQPTGPNKTIELHKSPDYALEPVYGKSYHPGWSGLFSTVHDIWRFGQMLANGGELDGERLLSPKTVNLMATNHSGDKAIGSWGPGYGMGLGLGVLVDAGKARVNLTPGSFSHRGGWGTGMWIDPVENMVGVFMTQLTTYRHISFRDDAVNIAIQAITDSYSNKPYKVMGYTTRH